MAQFTSRNDSDGRFGARLVAVDVGNSGVKYALADFEHGPMSAARRWEPTETGQHGDALPGEGLEWWIASVAAAPLRRLMAWLVTQRPRDRVRVLTHADIPLDIAVDQPGGVGIDRLVAATAALDIVGQGVGSAIEVSGAARDVIVIDAGTAITIDVVTRDGRFLGGTISAGWRSRLRALHQSAPALPDLAAADLSAAPPVIGRSTEEAILSGARLTQVAAILGIVRELSNELAQPPAVVATGGDLRPIADRLPGDWLIVDDLVLAGVVQLARRITNHIPVRHGPS